VDDVRDTFPVGAVRGSVYLPAGYVKANGATVNRADYPRLVALADTFSLWTADTANNAGLFGEGDGTTTMVLPNFVDRMMQFAATAGEAVAAGLPNIAGKVAVASVRKSWTQDQLGAFSDSVQWGNARLNGYTDNSFNISEVGMDASRSSSIYGLSTTVQPPAVSVFPILRY